MATKAKRLAARAIEWFQDVGPAAFKTISEGIDGFRDRDLPVFVAEANRDGKVVAHAGSPQGPRQVSRRLLEIRNPRSEAIGQLLLDQATDEGNGIDDTDVDPVTNKVEHKFSWVVRFEKHLFGCGI